MNSQGGGFVPVFVSDVPLGEMVVTNHKLALELRRPGCLGFTVAPALEVPWHDPLHRIINGTGKYAAGRL